jgi:hypothetical protein
MQTLREWLPREAVGGEYHGDPFQKYLDVEVVSEHQFRWPGRHKNVINWCKLANGKAVGWNENDAIGWSFPVITVKG